MQVSTLGQPLEVVKTQMASNRKQTMAEALKVVASRGGVLGFYQGLIPWVSPIEHSISEHGRLILTFAFARLGLRHRPRVLFSSLPLPRLKR